MVKAIQRALTSVAYEQVYHPELGVHERVLAYELYHQLRCLESNGNLEIRPARLHAELNKTAQAYFGDGEATPDLLVHDPHDNRTNRLVLELKRVARGQAAAVGDLSKLAKFFREPLVYDQLCLVLCCENDLDWDTAGRWVQNWKDSGTVPIQVLSYDARSGRVQHEAVGWEENPISP